MPTVPDEYPYGLDDADLHGVLTTLLIEYQSAGHAVNAAMQYGALIALGQTDLQARQALRDHEALRTAIEALRTSSEKAARRLARLTWALIVLTVVLAIATIVLVAKT